MSDPSWDNALIQTKLYRPAMPVDLVLRPQLIDWFDKRRKRPLTLVSAPAGYGKSTLVSSWLETCKYPHTWLTLDEQDNDLIGFLTYFLEAIRVIFPDAAKNTQALLAAYTQPTIKELSITLANEINQLDQFFVLVLDDFEVIQDNLIHDFLDDFVLHPPRVFHLVLCTRVDPLLSIQTLRGQGQITEIRAQDLRFSVEESVTFLQNMLGATVDISIVKKMDQQSEGWVTGLRLAALALRHRKEQLHIDGELSVNNRYVSEYLTTTILENQAAAISDGLLKISILDRFCAELCQAVCGSETETGDAKINSENFMAWLQSSNLFVIPLDDYGQWVRFHHLFREFLQGELESCYKKKQIVSLHTRASAWFAQNGLINEAISHALKAGDTLGAAQLVGQNARSVLDQDQWHVLEKWIAQLPDDIVQERPELLIAKAWVAFHHFALGTIPPLLESVERILEDNAPNQPLWGEVNFFWGHHLYWQGQRANCLAKLNRALDRIPKEHHLARGETELFWSLASQMSGQKYEAIQQLNQWLYYEKSLHPGRKTKLLGSLVFIYLLAGELTQSTSVTQQLQDLAVKHNIPYIKTWTSYLHGVIHYCRNEMEDANRCFASAVENQYILHTAAAIDSLAGLCLTYQAMEQPEDANAVMTQMHEFAQGLNKPNYMTLAYTCQARLSLLQGDLASAMNWIGMADLSSDTGVMFYWLEIPRLTKCRILIAEGTPASLQEATENLQKYRLMNETQHNTRQLIDVLVLQALAYQKQKQTDQALAALERAIILAEPGGWIWPFMEPGAELFQLLGQLVKKQGALKYANDILKTLEPTQSTQVSTPAQPASQVVEPLTNREFEIIELLGKRLTNKEIASEIHITVGTVQQHLNHIYSKLDVKGRRQAIAKAAELALLPPHQ